MKLDYATHDTAIYNGIGKTAAHFNSIHAFAEYAGIKEHCESCFNRCDRWTAEASGKDMYNFIEQVKMPSDIMRRLDADIELEDIDGLQGNQLTPTVVFCEDGFMCDTTAFYAGEEDCMLNFDNTMQRTKTIWLASSIISSGLVSAETMINRGVALIRATKTLQKHGYNVGLVVYIHGGNIASNNKMLLSVAVKRPEEALNETIIAAAFAHPSFFRTLGHNATAKLNKASYGSMMSLPTPTREQFKGSFINPDDLHILDGNFNYSDCKTPEKAEQWIKNGLAKIMLEIENNQQAAA